jgi:phage shock protein E
VSLLQWVLIGLTLLLVGWMLLKRRGDITAEEARRWVENGALLLDVRTATEFSAGHLPSARNVPVGELQRKLNEIGAKDRPIVVYCLSGSRSAMAKRLLQSAGFQKIANLGSMSRW